MLRTQILAVIGGHNKGTFFFFFSFRKQELKTHKNLVPIGTLVNVSPTNDKIASIKLSSTKADLKRTE